MYLSKEHMIVHHLSILNAELKRLKNSHLDFQNYLFSTEGEVLQVITSNLLGFCPIEDNKTAFSYVIELLHLYNEDLINENDLLYAITTVDEDIKNSALKTVLIE